MRIRLGFVSNSSSSSFAISLRYLSVEQLCKILNHSYWGKKLGIEYADEGWNTEIESGILYGWTIMDNFDMGKFLDKIGVNPDTIKWGERGGYDNEDCTDEQPNECKITEEMCKNCHLRFFCYTNKTKEGEE